MLQSELNDYERINAYDTNVLLFRKYEIFFKFEVCSIIILWIMNFIWTLYKYGWDSVSRFKKI